MNVNLRSVVKLLSSGNATPRQSIELAIASMKNNTSFSVFTAILNAGALNVHDFSLLQEAVIASDTRYLSALLDAGTSIDAKMHYGQSFLHVANSASVAMLLKRGANPNATDARGLRPLHAICLRDFDLKQKIHAIKLLLAAGADVNAVGSDGRTPLHCALCFDKAWTIEVVNVLLDAGANANAVDINGISVLESAMRTPIHRRGLCGLLVKFGADVFRAFNDGSFPLHAAASASFWDYEGLISMLLRAGRCEHHRPQWQHCTSFCGRKRRV